MASLKAYLLWRCSFGLTKRFVFLLCMMPMALWAQTDAAPQLAGVWQQIQVVKQKQHPVKLPVWKVLQESGAFCTFLIANQSGQSIITNEGRYERLNDSTYVEHVTGSITDPDLVGHDNVISYRFKGPDRLEVHYQIPGATHEGRETWVRVKLQMPSDED